MYCPHCGKEIADDAVVCINCGRSVNSLKKDNMVSVKWETGIYALLIIGAILIPAIGIILGLINIDNPIKKEQAKVLLIIGIINFVLTFLIIAL